MASAPPRPWEADGALHIACVGGLDRAEGVLALTAARAGCVLECHDGDVRGRGAASLRAAVVRADLVVVAVEVNSHGGVLLAKKLCRELGRRLVVVRRLGPGRLESLLDALRTHPHLQRAS